MLRHQYAVRGVGEPAIDLNGPAGRRKVPLRPVDGNLPHDEVRCQGEEYQACDEDPRTVGDSLETRLRCNHESHRSQ